MVASRLGREPGSRGTSTLLQEAKLPPWEKNGGNSFWCLWNNYILGPFFRRFQPFNLEGKSPNWFSNKFRSRMRTLGSSSGIKWRSVNEQNGSSYYKLRKKNINKIYNNEQDQVTDKWKSTCKLYGKVEQVWTWLDHEYASDIQNLTKQGRSKCETPPPSYCDVNLKLLQFMYHSKVFVFIISVKEHA
jgi:hypothetical protein